MINSDVALSFEVFTEVDYAFLSSILLVWINKIIFLLKIFFSSH